MNKQEEMEEEIRYLRGINSELISRVNTREHEDQYRYYYCQNCLTRMYGIQSPLKTPANSIFEGCIWGVIIIISAFFVLILIALISNPNP